MPHTFEMSRQSKSTLGIDAMIVIGVLACASTAVGGAGSDMKGVPPATDLFGDPLPSGAIARLGTERFRHGPHTSSLAFTPDGKILASGGGVGNGACLWDAATGRLLYRCSVLNPIDRDISSLGFTADGKTLVTGGATLSLIDVATGKAIRRLEGPPNTPQDAVAVSSDGRTVAGGAGERGGAEWTIGIWDVVANKELRRLKGHAGFIQSIAFAPDGKTLASGSDDKSVRVWDVATGQELRRLEGHSLQLNAVAFSPGGKVLASAAEDGALLLWDPKTGKLLHELEGEKRITKTLAFSPDGKVLASGTQGGTICIWDPTTGNQLRTWPGHATVVAALAFTPDGKLLASSGAWDSAIRLWDPSTGKEVNPPAGHTGIISQLVFAPNGKTLSTCATDRKVLEWDLATGRQARQLFAGPVDSDEASWQWPLLALSPDTTVLARTGVRWDRKPDDGIRLWDTTKGMEIRTLKGGDWASGPRFSPDSKLLARSAKDGTRLWEVATGRQVHHFQDNQAFGSTIAFSPDGGVMALLRPGNSICVWDVATGKELRRWDTPEELGHLAFSPDGKLLVSCNENVHIWTAATGKKLFQLDGQGARITCLAFSSTGRILAAQLRRVQKLMNGDLAETKIIQFWETHSGRAIRHIETTQGLAYSLAFAPDGRTLASGGGDATVLLWDLTGRTKADPAILTAAQLDAAWSDLAGDATKADLAIWTLALRPDQSAAFLKQRLWPATPPDAQQISKLIADLDSNSFAAREKASRTLEKWAKRPSRCCARPWRPIRPWRSGDDWSRFWRNATTT